MSTMLARIFGAALVAAMLVAGAGCDRDEGPAEEAGESIDEAVEETRDAAEEAGENIRDAAEETREAAEDAAEEIEEDTGG